MSLRSLIQRHAAELLTTEVQIELSVGGKFDRVRGRQSEQQTMRYTVTASDIGNITRRTRDGTSIAQAGGPGGSDDAFFYVPVPIGGLPFEPTAAQAVIVYGKRWTVRSVRPDRAHGTIVGYRVHVSQGGR